jgi:hypothetical protein
VEREIVRRFGKNMEIIETSINKNGTAVFATEMGDLLWEGKPLEISVKSLYRIPYSMDFIVLLNWDEAIEKKQRNLLRFSCFGKVIWIVEKPKVEFRFMQTPGIDIYTGITGFEEGLVHAFSCLGYSDRIDLAEGRIISTEFVK